MRKSGMISMLAAVLMGAIIPLVFSTGTVSAEEGSTQALRPDAIAVSSKYPSATGPADTTFMFAFELMYRVTDLDPIMGDYDTGKLQSRVFDFELTGPPGWQVFVAESSWKLDTRIKAAQLRALGVPQPMVVMASAPWWTNVTPGEYPIQLKVSSGDIGDTLELKAIVTAWYGIEATTAGDRLNTKTTAGAPAAVDLKVVNTGSAVLDKVSVSSSRPAGIANEQWVVRLEPDSIRGLEPGDEGQLRVSITPPRNAISGDYYVTLTLASEPALSDFNPQLDVRVSVETKPSWVIVGVLIVVLAFGALVYAFYALRQR